MSGAHERLQEARRAAGYESATAAATAFGWEPSTYLGHENGSRGLRAGVVRRYAAAFNARPDWILFGGAEEAPRPEAAQSALSERIQSRLTELKLTAITAATRRGYPRDLIRNVLRTEANPRADSLVAIADCLDVTVGWLMGETGEREAGEQATGPDLCVRHGKVAIDIKAEVSVGVAAQILALIEGDK